MPPAADFTDWPRTPEISIPFVPDAEDATLTVPFAGHDQLIGCGLDLAGAAFLIRLGILVAAELFARSTAADFLRCCSGARKRSRCPTLIKFGFDSRFHFESARKSMPKRHAIEYKVSPRLTTYDAGRTAVRFSVGPSERCTVVDSRGAADLCAIGAVALLTHPLRARTSPITTPPRGLLRNAHSSTGNEDPQPSPPTIGTKLTNSRICSSHPLTVFVTNISF